MAACSIKIMFYSTHYSNTSGNESVQRTTQVPFPAIDWTQLMTQAASENIDPSQPVILAER